MILDQNEFREMPNALNAPTASPSTLLNIESASSSNLVVSKTNKRTYLFHSCTVHLNKISENAKSEKNETKICHL